MFFSLEIDRNCLHLSYLICNTVKLHPEIEKVHTFLFIHKCFEKEVHHLLYLDIFWQDESHLVNKIQTILYHFYEGPSEFFSHREVPVKSIPLVF